METKEYILKSAYDMFLRNNYEAVTISKIGVATNLTKGAIYHHFASKEELFKAVVDKYLFENKKDFGFKRATLHEYIQLTLEEAYKKLTEKKADYIADTELSPIHDLSFIVDAYKYYPGFAELGIEFYMDGIRRWEICIKDAISRGEVRSDIDIKSTALIFIAIISSIGEFFLIDKTNSENFNRVKDQMEQMYKLIKV